MERDPSMPGQGSERVRQSASDVAGKAKETTKRVASTQKNAAASYVGQFSQALHSSAQHLEPNNPTTASYVHKAAERIDRFSSTLQERSIDDMVRDVRDMARRRPGVLLGGAVVLGFLLTRFLKASAENEGEYGYGRWQEDREGWRYGQRYGRGYGYGTGTETESRTPESGSFTEPGGGSTPGGTTGGF